jgi:hypothetical protein
MPGRGRYRKSKKQVLGSVDGRSSLLISRAARPRRDHARRAQAGASADHSRTATPSGGRVLARQAGPSVLARYPTRCGRACALERRTGRSGKDTVDHEARDRDDIANAACGALVLASPRGRGWSSHPEAMDRAGGEAKELCRMWADRRRGLGQTGRRIADFGIRHPHERDDE